MTEWRRGWDSNPRDPFGPNGFQDRRFQPLTHPSGSLQCNRQSLPSSIRSRAGCSNLTGPAIRRTRGPLSVSMTAAVPCGTMSGIVEIGEAHNGDHVELIAPQILRITLPEVRTSGFRWVMRPFDHHTVALVADEFEPGVSGQGGGATHRWEFRAETTGAIEIAFDYRRPWERALPAARSFSVSVRVT